MLYIFVPYINIKTYCSYFLNAKSLFTLILCSNFMDNEYALLHTDSVLMKCLVHLQRYPLLIGISCFHSPQFSRSVVSNSLRPCESQHASPPLSITDSWRLGPIYAYDLHFFLYLEFIFSQYSRNMSALDHTFFSCHL